MKLEDDENKQEPWIKINPDLGETLRVVYQSTTSSRDDYRTRIWETMKISATLEAGILASSAVIVAAVINGKSGNHDVFFLPFFFIFGIYLILIGLSIMFWSYGNLIREQNLLYQDEYTLFQIEKLLGLHKPIQKNLQWLTDSEFLFSQKHLGDITNFSVNSATKDDPVIIWAKTKTEAQAFLQYTAVGFSAILLSPLLFFGVSLIIYYFNNS